MEMQSIPQSAAPCAKCQTLNSPQTGACSMCGARLPWADALQSQLAQKREAEAMHAAALAKASRQATISQAGETVSKVGAWVLPVVAVGAVVLVVGAIMVAGAQGGYVILPVGLIARVLLRSLWND